MRIAPKLKDDIRVRLSGRLPPRVKEALRAYSRRHDISMSWIVENIILDAFHVKVEYKDAEANKKARVIPHKPRLATARKRAS